MKKSLLSCLLCSLMFLGCKDEDKLFGADCEGNDCFTLERFEQKLIENLEDEKENTCIVKYTYALQLGFANFDGAWNRPDIPHEMTVSDRFNPASVTKMITATALLKALEERNISIETSIAGFLPQHWNIHDSFANINFRMVLSHHSGIRANANDISHHHIKNITS